MSKGKETNAKIEILRYNPNTGKRYIQTYVTPFDSGWSVMNSLLYIYEELDSSLGVPYMCLQGRCMGCAMRVNGKTTCACSTPMERNMRVEAVSNLRVIKDLIVEYGRANISYDPEKCTKCGLCVEICPINIWSVSDRKRVAEKSKDDVLCIGCGECEKSCKGEAIRIELVK